MGAIHPELPKRDRSDRCCDQSDRCLSFVGFALDEFLDSRDFGCCWRWSVLGWFGDVLLSFVKGSSSL
jgi:hypothetical protein